MCTLWYTKHRYTTKFSIETHITVLLCGTAEGTNTTLVVTLLSDTNCVVSVKTHLLVRT